MGVRVTAVLALTVLGPLVAACSSGEESNLGTIEEFCDDAGELRQSLSGLGQQVDVTPDQLAEVRDDLEAIKAPEELRQDLDVLARVIAEVLEGLDDADLDDPSVLAEVQDRLAGVEAAGQEIDAAGTRVASAIEGCP